MIRQPITRRRRVFLGVFSIVLILGAYTEVSRRQHRENPDDTTIPTWGQFADGMRKMTEVNSRTDERWLVVDAKATAQSLFLGLLYGVIGAIVVGLLMGCFCSWEAFLLPPMSLLAKSPPTAMLAIFLVLCTTNTQMFVAMIAFGVLPTLSQSIYLAVRDVPEELLYKAYTLGASRSEVVWNVVVRAILPRLIDGIRLSIGPAMVYLIAAEWITGWVGFGYRFRIQMRLLNMNVVYPYIAILALFGFSMDFGLRVLQRYVCPWHRPEGR